MNSRTKPADFFSRDEIRVLTERSDLAGWWAVGSTWAIIALSFAMLARWPSPFTFILAVAILGGRQLALAILSHEAAHRTLFKTRVLNDTVADWFCARLIWNDVRRYREHHLRHHAHTGTELDPDMSLVRPFPTTRRSLAKKFLRDLTGQSGVRRMIGQFLMDVGVFKYTVAANIERRPPDGRIFRDYLREGAKNMSGVLLGNLALAGLLAAADQLWLYSAWIAAYLTTFSLYLRIRSLAEHACTERTDDFWLNTRTTRAGVLARLTVAPMHVNFHREHHLLPAVPWFRLPQMHQLLKKRGAVIVPPPKYTDVLATVTAVPA
jgi:fatty acid desaturase